MIETPGDIWRNNAMTFPDQDAWVIGGQRISHRAHFERAQKPAPAICGLGVRGQDRVAVLCRNTRAFMEVYTAAGLSGLVVATVNWRLAPPEMAHIRTYVGMDGPAPDRALDHDALLASGDVAGAPDRPAPNCASRN